MKNIKICLTERWYSWEEARVAAMEDEEVDLYADPDKGQSAYLPKELTEVSPSH
jgi:large subunit ribosomal protein L47